MANICPIPRVHAYNPVFPNDYQIVKLLGFKLLFRNICCLCLLRKPPSFHCYPLKKLKIEQSFGLCGRGREWDDLGEWH